MVDRPEDFLARLSSQTFPATGPACAKAVIHSTALDEIEKAGGSLRCMVAEIF